MRGRSLIKETSSPNLCAFCAHRLGQTRTPSHVQRRFIQSSQPLTKPPAEGVAVQQNEENRTVLPTWGQAGGNKNGRAPGPIGNWGQSIASSTRATQSSVGVTTAPSPKVPELSPHEKRARELLLQQSLQTQQHPMQHRHFGAGPSSNRAGRYIPKNRTPLATGSGHRDHRIGQSLDARDRVRGSDRNNWFQRGATNSSEGADNRPVEGEVRNLVRHNLSRADPTFQDSEPRDNATPRFSIKRQAPQFTSRTGDRHTPIHERDTSSRVGAKDDAEEQPVWANLRRKTEEQAQEKTPFEQARLEREESAKVATYSPLTIGSQISEQRYQRQDPPRQASNWNSGSDRGQRGGNNRYDRYQGGRYDAYGPTISHNGYRADVPVTSNQMRLREQAKPQQEVQHAFETQQVNLANDDISAYVPSSRDKQKSSRSQYVPEEKGRGKGKDRDKARRRQHFVGEEDAEEEAAEERARAEQKRLRKAQKEAKKAAAPTPLLLPEYITVENLAVALKVKFEDFLDKLHDLGYEEISRDHILNAENAGLIAGEYNFEAIIDRSESEDLKAREPAPDPSVLPPRPPVVTIMGHVDHGKTTLLDFLRKSSVAAGEHGGITQHIGAFSVPMPGGKTITFLDTPGHAAFLSMRQRGANVTDIVILVVAADDSVKPQTIEAINHAKAAGVPMIVAINKIDKGDSNVERVKQDLGRHGVELEDFGGDTQSVLVSGKTGQGMAQLEEAAVTLSEILDMRSEVDGPAEGWVLEASIKSMGKVATILVRRGTMRVGDFIVAGKTWARIRCLRNEAGVEIAEAGPGTPVEIDGWRDQPLAGDEVLQAPDEAKAKSVVVYRLESEERNKLAEDMEAVNANRKAEQEKREREKAEAAARAAAAEAGEGEDGTARKTDSDSGPKQIYFIIKGDVSGSVEAVVDSLQILGNKEVQINIIRSGVGQISEFDIEHTAAAKGYLINFNTTVEPNISQMAEKAKVKILDHNIIYRLVDDVRATLSEYLPPLITQRVTGEAEIAQVFEISLKGRKTKKIAGCKIRNGTITKTERVRVIRDGEKVFDGRLDSLKNVKKEVSEMKKGTECGMGFLEWADFQVGDQIQTYEQKEEKRYL